MINDRPLEGKDGVLLSVMPACNHCDHLWCIFATWWWYVENILWCSMTRWWRYLERIPHCLEEAPRGSRHPDRDAFVGYDKCWWHRRSPAGRCRSQGRSWGRSPRGSHRPERRILDDHPGGDDGDDEYDDGDDGDNDGDDGERNADSYEAMQECVTTKISLIVKRKQENHLVRWKPRVLPRVSGLEMFVQTYFIGLNTLAMV